MTKGEKYVRIEYQKMKSEVLDFILLPVICIFAVICFHTNDALNLQTTYYDCPYLLIDRWFFVHISANLALAAFYPYTLTVERMLLLVLGWEVLENIIVPIIYSKFGLEMLSDFSEADPFGNTFGDILAAVPGLIVLQFQSGMSKN